MPGNSSTPFFHPARWLDAIERNGNRLPHPALLFLYMALGVLVLSAIAAWAGLSAQHPITGDTIPALNLMSVDGLHRILAGTVTNFTGFAPVGIVLVAMLGIGIAEQSGLIAALLRRLVLAAPARLLSFFVAFAGVLSSLAVDAGYVVLIPLAALVYHAAGRHPVAGIATAFAATAAGFSANLLIGPLDAMLASLSTEGVRLVDEHYTVSPAGNWWFIIVSTFLLALIIALVTDKLTERRLLPADGTPSELSGDALPDNLERRGLRAAGLVSLAFLSLVLWGLIPAQGFLRHPETGDILSSPFISGIVVVITFWIALAGFAFGKAAGTLKTGRDLIAGMENTMATMAGYLVLMFFAAQFVAWFNWTNLGVISAIAGSEFLRALNPGPMLLLLAFVFLSAFINLFIGSASAKWAIMAPIFVPMLYLLGISPEGTQMAYRIGDSASNVITPLMPYFALVVTFAERYDKRAGLGTIMATMLPYSIALLAAWSMMLGLWFWLDLPLGPGTYLLLP